jgi:predicted nucleic acid-binding protein
VTAYVDTSVLLRVVLAEPGRLGSWKAITRPVASELVRLECLRTIDRARIRLGLGDEEVALRREAVLEQLDAFELIPLDPAVLERAAEPFPTVVGALDALHLASALLARAELPDLRLATHDRGLVVAARAMGFDVLS